MLIRLPQRLYLTIPRTQTKQQTTNKNIPFPCYPFPCCLFWPWPAVAIAIVTAKVSVACELASFAFVITSAQKGTSYFSLERTTGQKGNCTNTQGQKGESC